MRHVVLTCSVLGASLLLPRLVAAEQAAPAPSLKCDIGPVTKVYGASQWLVYSCDDSRTVVVVSAPGSPAFPFYFTLSPTASGYRLSGEGTGKKEATAAALNELSKLSGREIASLIEQTKPHQKQ